MRFCNYVLFVLLFACALNTEGQIHKSVLWTVSLDTSQQITISTGDMLWVKSPTFAAVPANLGKIFQISYDHSRLSLIAEKPPDSDGQMGKQYFLLAVAPGASQVTITVLDQGKTSSTVVLDVTCR